ncbi:ShlB/FhaC/HecB family hemolysin secretion/activation protein [Anthocerotibacter panamensis]|uniref:ShlB/FhaC/HecB family hemolysin secretion/activation protein n=1 Tax=Anthocerotibacter panamensis TaxID=2857077 RepID=UPI001C405DC4|nr:ShlB/FhaC/HecB family hemolysin secretion/activation protein [Anthocerotibacter panamensis]
MLKIKQSQQLQNVKNLSLKSTRWLQQLLLSSTIFPTMMSPCFASDDFTLPATQASFLLAQQPPLPPANPQADPNRDRLLPAPSPAPLPPTSDQLQPSAPPAPVTPAPVNVQIAVRRIDVVGSTLFGPEILDPLTKPLEGKTVSGLELRKVADAITRLYGERGYVTSRALAPAPQEIQDGLVQIRVLEGRLKDTIVKGTERLAGYVRERVQGDPGRPLNTIALEERLRLLRSDPLFSNVEASLRREETPSGVPLSVLTVQVNEAAPLGITLGFDNYTPPAVGTERARTNLRYRNLLGLGDELTASYYVATGSLNIYDFSYRLPVNPENGAFQFRVTTTNNRITQAPFDTFNIRGNSDLYEVSFRQPFVRNSNEELALSAGFTYQSGQTFIFNDTPAAFGVGPDADGRSTTSVFKLGQDYSLRDATGIWNFQSQFSIGVGLFGATINSSPIPDGRFVSWLVQAQRLQSLGNGNLLTLQASTQLTTASLLPSQQFIIGGGQSIRGYRQNTRSGDFGFRVSAEARFPVIRSETGAPIFSLTPFVEAGGVTNNGSNPNSLPDRNFLASVGVGFLWQVLPHLDLKVDYGIPLVPLDTRGNTLQDDGIHFSLNYGL